MNENRMNDRAPSGDRIFLAAWALLAATLCAFREPLRAFLSPLDWVDLPIHETGHLVFQFFGRFIYVAGGTIGQLAMPAAFWWYFRDRREFNSADVCLIWIGQNFLNIGRYAADARAQKLELVAGGVHDWTYLLERTHLLIHDEGVGRAIDWLGCAVIAFALVSIARRLMRGDPPQAAARAP